MAADEVKPEARGLARDAQGNAITRNVPAGDEQLAARVKGGVDSKGNRKARKASAPAGSP